MPSRNPADIAAGIPYGFDYGDSWYWEEKRKQEIERLKNKFSMVKDTPPLVTGKVHPRVEFNFPTIEAVQKQADNLHKVEALKEDQAARGMPRGVLADYHQMQTLYGDTAKANKRIQDVARLYNRYMEPSTGKQVIWQLASSPLTLDAIEVMLQQAHGQTFNFDPITMTMKPSMVPRKIVNDLKLDPSNPDDVRRAVYTYGMFGMNPAQVVSSAPWMERVFGKFGTMRLDALEGERADSFLTEGMRPNFEADLTKDKELVASYESVNFDKSARFRAMKPEIQKAIKELYEDDAMDTSPVNLRDWIASGRWPWSQWFDEANKEETQALESAASYWQAKYRINHEPEWQAHIDDVAGDFTTFAMQMTMLTPLAGGSGAAMLAGTGLKPLLGRAVVAGGLAMTLRGQIGSESAARAKAETGVAQAMLDPMGAIAYEQTIYLGPGETAPIQAKVTYADEANVLRSYLYTQEQATVEEIQRNFQKPVYSAPDAHGDRQLLSPGFGTDLEVTGVWDENWDPILDDYMEWEAVQNIQDIGTLIQTGALDAAHPNDGNMDDPAVVEAIGRLQVKWAEEDAFTRNPTVWGKILRTAGIPTSTNSLEMWWNQTKSQGLLQGVFRAPIEAAGMAGGGIDGMLAALTYETQKMNDPILGDRFDALMRYVRSQVGDTVGMHNDDIALQVVTDGVLKNDPQAQKLYQDWQQRSAQILNEEWGADIMAAVQNIVGRDPEKVKQFSRDHPELVPAINMAFFAALTIAGARIPIFTTSKAVLPTEEAFFSSQDAYVAVSNAQRHVRNGEWGLAARAVGSSRDAMAIVRDWQATKEGVYRKSAGLQQAARDIREGITAEEGAAVIERLTALRGKEAVQFYDDLMAELESVRQVPVLEAEPVYTGQAAVGEIDYTGKPRVTPHEQTPELYYREEYAYGKYQEHFEMLREHAIDDLVEMPPLRGNEAWRTMNESQAQAARQASYLRTLRKYDYDEMDARVRRNAELEGEELTEQQIAERTHKAMEDRWESWLNEWNPTIARERAIELGVQPDYLNPIRPVGALENVTLQTLRPSSREQLEQVTAEVTEWADSPQAWEAANLVDEMDAAVTATADMRLVIARDPEGNVIGMTASRVLENGRVKILGVAVHPDWMKTRVGNYLRNEVRIQAAREGMGVQELRWRKGKEPTTAEEALEGEAGGRLRIQVESAAAVSKRVSPKEPKPAQARSAETGRFVTPRTEVEQRALEYRIIGQALSRRQKAQADVVDMDNYVWESSAKWYARRSTDNTARAVYPFLRAKGMSRPSETKAWLEHAWEQSSDPVLRWMIGKTWKLWEYAPQSYIRPSDPLSMDMIFNDALAASRGDIRFAKQVRNDWVKATQAWQYEKIIDRVVKMADGNFKLDRLMGGEQRIMAGNINPETGLPTTEGALLMSGRSAYVYRLNGIRQVLHASYDVGELDSAGAVVDQILRNPMRWGRKELTEHVGTPLRRLAVGVSPNLGFKHMVVDLFGRLPLEQGILVMFKGRNYSRRYAALLDQVEPTIASDTQLSLHTLKMSLQQYYSGNGPIPRNFEPKQIYEVNPKTGKLEPINMEAGVADLRRWVLSKDFQVFAEGERVGGEGGGVTALEEWLYTNEGRVWLSKESGNLQWTKENVAEALNAKGKDLYDLAVQDYLARVQEQAYTPLKEVAPNIFEGLTDIVVGERPLKDTVLQQIVEDANKIAGTENPWLEIGIETKKSAFAKANPMNWIGTWMIPNKMARERFYKSTFVDTAEGLIKNGVEPNSAVRIATDVAELKTTRVMFDLANATYLEAANRLFAYFATKHRLYATYIGKMVIERPWIAGAATELLKWMEARNESKPGVPEWDKNKFILDMPWLPGPWKRAVMDIQGIYWMHDYPVESSFGKYGEYALAQVGRVIPGVSEVIDRIPGVSGELNINWGSFPNSFSRFDRLITTTWAAWPILQHWGDEDGEAWLKEYLEDPNGTQGMKEQLRKAISLQMLYGQMNGEPITAWDAARRAAWSGMVFEALQAGKPLPFMFRREEDVKINEFEEEYFNALPQDRLKMLDDPQYSWAAYSWGLKTRNPAKRDAVQQGWDDFNDIYDRWAKSLYAAVDDGSILQSDVFNGIMNKYELEIQALVDPDYVDPVTGTNEKYNPDFAEEFREGGTEQLLKEEAFRILVPLMDPTALVKEGYMPTYEQKLEYKAKLEADFDEERKEQGYLPADKSNPAYFQAYYDAVELPYRNFARVDPSNWMTYRQETAMDVMAKGGEPGVTTAAAYSAMMYNQFALRALGRGIQGNSKSGADENNPLMALMYPNEKEMVGWKTTPEATRRWQIWALAKAVGDQWVSQQDKTAQSALADKVRANLQKLGQQLSTQDATFKKEWDFSMLPLQKRMRALGIGSGDDAAASSWDTFLNIVEAFRKELSETVNPSNKKVLGVGPQAQAGAEVHKKYLRMLEESRLKEDTIWWYEFKGLFPLSSFGFTKQFARDKNGNLIASDYWWATEEDVVPEEEQLY